MDKENKNLQKDDTIELAKEAYGFGDHQLLNQFDRAMQETKEQGIEDEQVVSGYKNIVNTIESRGVTPTYREENERKPIRLKHMGKVLLVAAVLGAMVFGLATGTYGKKYYRYTAREVDGGKNVRVRNDGEDVVLDNKMDNVYEEIKDNLDIKVLQLLYIPKGLSYEKLDMTNEHAILEFNYNGSRVYFIQSKYLYENVGNYQSDCDVVQSIENEWLDKDIKLEKNILENGEKEYKAKFEVGDCEYVLTGKIEEEIFIEIVKNITYY